MLVLIVVNDPQLQGSHISLTSLWLASHLCISCRENGTLNTAPIPQQSVCGTTREVSLHKDPKFCAVSIARILHSPWKKPAAAFSLLEATWSNANCQQESQGMRSPVAHVRGFFFWMHMNHCQARHHFQE